MKTIVILGMVIFFSQVAQATVAVPAGYELVQESLYIQYNKKEQCSYPEPFKSDLSFVSRYKGSDSARDVVNASADKDYKESTKAMRDLQLFVAEKVDDIILGKGGLITINCVLDALIDWKDNSTLLSDTNNKVGIAVRKWTLAAISSCLLKVNKILEKYETDKYKLVQTWVGLIAEKVKDDYSDRPLRKINNHDYWAAWSVITTAALLDREDLYLWAKTVYSTAMNQVDEDGFLPNELRRQTRSAMYHNYALTPLVGIAVFLDANQEKPLEYNNQALLRLFNLVIASVSDVSVFENKTHENQIDYDLFSSGRLAWLAMFITLYPIDDDVKNILVKARPLSSSRLGGNLELIYMRKNKS